MIIMVIVLALIIVVATAATTAATTTAAAVRVAVAAEVPVMLDVFLYIPGKQSILQQCHSKIQVYHNIDLGNSLDLVCSNWDK